MSTQPNNAPPASVTDAVLVASEPVPEGTHKVSGVDFEKYQGRDITVAEMVDNMKYMGFQSSAVADAARIINEMVSSYPGPSRLLASLTLPFLQSARIDIPKPATKPRFSSATPPI
jgi:hypothetical protein